MRTVLGLDRIGEYDRLFTGKRIGLITNYSGVDPEVVDPFTGYDNFLNYPLARKLTLGLTVRF